MPDLLPGVRARFRPEDARREHSREDGRAQVRRLREGLQHEAVHEAAREAVLQQGLTATGSVPANGFNLKLMPVLLCP